MYFDLKHKKYCYLIKVLAYHQCLADKIGMHNKNIFCFSYPVVLSSVTGSVIKKVIPFSASGVILIAFLTVLITGVNHIVEWYIGMLIMIAHRLVHRHNYW